MDKLKQKKRDNKRAEAIKLIAKQFDCSIELVRMVLNNKQYSYGKADAIRKAFKEKYTQLKQILV
ncbi:MAG: hypothetical protein JST21_02320 [Bacteroidetes bacterium]|nr:hypothetical protein [Bacteroidota bacterium]